MLVIKIFADSLVPLLIEVNPVNYLPSRYMRIDLKVKSPRPYTIDGAILCICIKAKKNES